MLEGLGDLKISELKTSSKEVLIQNYLKVKLANKLILELSSIIEEKCEDYLPDYGGGR